MYIFTRCPQCKLQCLTCPVLQLQLVQVFWCLLETNMSWDMVGLLLVMLYTSFCILRDSLYLLKRCSKIFGATPDLVPKKVDSTPSTKSGTNDDLIEYMECIYMIPGEAHKATASHRRQWCQCFSSSMVFKTLYIYTQFSKFCKFPGRPICIALAFQGGLM